MLLLIDAGNTQTVLGTADQADDPESIAASWRFSSNPQRTIDEWDVLLRSVLDSAATGGDVDGVAIASVVPAMTPVLTKLAARYSGAAPLVVHAGLDLGIAIEANPPSAVGADRLVNAAYAFARFGAPTIVVDLGTATKIEAIATGGRYLGGVIAPGIGMGMDALASRAAKLSAVELRAPAVTIGRDTASAVQSGVVTGHIAMIEGMVERVRAELGGATHVVLTGGYSSLVAMESAVFTAHIPDLTLLGLRLVFERNRYRP
jgi:type III pantothenate kinase